MGRVKFNDVEKYSNSSSGGSFFSLKNDKDVAQVRLLIDGKEGLDDINYVVHKVKVNSGEYPRSVNCLRDYNEPVDKCPLCAAGYNPVCRLFIPLYNMDTDEVQIFERGNTFAGKLASNVSRYGEKTPLASHVFEIERNGKPNDQRTTYELYEVDCDDTTLDDLPEAPQVIGNYFVLDKTAEEMEYFLQEGEFPQNNGDDDDGGTVRRRSMRHQTAEEPDEEEGDIPFDGMNEPEEEPTTRRGNRSNSGARNAGVDNRSRRTPASNNGGRRQRSF